MSSESDHEFDFMDNEFDYSAITDEMLAGPQPTSAPVQPAQVPTPTPHTVHSASVSNPPATQPATDPPTNERSSSFDYFTGDDMDDAFFIQASAELAALDRHSATSVASVPLPTPSSSKRARTDSQTLVKSPANKKRRRESSDPGFAELLSAFHEDLMCPICTDYFVFAHSVHPCGHTFCAPCAYAWTTERQKTTCPECRETLSSWAPNYLVNNILQRHLDLLGRIDPNNNGEWKPGGKLMKEWNQRQETSMVRKESLSLVGANNQPTPASSAWVPRVTWRRSVSSNPALNLSFTMRTSRGLDIINVDASSDDQ